MYKIIWILRIKNEILNVVFNIKYEWNNYNFIIVN